MIENAMREPAFVHLLRAGEGYGLFILGLGFLSTLWGGVNLLLRAPGRANVLIQAFASLLPAVVGVFGVLASYEQFAVLAMSDVAPKPSEIAMVVSRAMACGLFGPLATIVPVSLGLFGLLKAAHRATPADNALPV
ncbi:hypothetical protein Mal4_52940 [Maioricimonas rarisocia]|uniref:MotA/TolQ/ExbB proton channel domain-containing protein n=1 Tax=Maioricimonas rarisocia TaxID=2528026 RepID=A0A517ZEN5_9PLAN|nr:hypothetical protein [Maioricimonas rarisocia]QDU40931.1 hypothetical protein Mal4_52940 [Maioricimonas rarisocia]